VDVVADGGAVFGGVVVAEDSEVRATTHGHLCQEGEQVVRDAEGFSPSVPLGWRLPG